MVDCELYDLSRISNDVRVKIINYVMEQKHVRAKDLGVTLNLISMIRSGKRRVTEDLLCRAMAYLSAEELAKLLGGVPEFERATLNDILKVIATARADADFRDMLISYMERYLGDYIRNAGRQWVVEERDIEEYIKAMKLKGVKEKTLRDNLHYLRRALAELGWVLNPDDIREYLYEVLEEEGPNVARHISRSLKSFLKQVLRVRDPYLFSVLYYSFTTFRSESSVITWLPTIEQLREILQRIESIEAKTYFILQIETGLRPGILFTLRMDQVDLENGVIRIGKVTRTKREFIAFIRPETLDFIRRYYLPRREQVLKMTTPGMLAAEWSRQYVGNREDRFMPFKRGRLRNEIKEAAMQVLGEEKGEEFTLYLIRKFFATWMISRGVPESIVNTLQGRAPAREYRVLIEHYWSPRHEELRKWYLEHAPCLLC